MENRLKERLTGAAILVALIVMLVPEMFRGQGGEVLPTSGSSGDGPPVRSYTIDLSNNPKHNGPLLSTTAEPASVAQPQLTGAESVKAQPAKTEAPSETAKPESVKPDTVDKGEAKAAQTPAQTATHLARAVTAAGTSGAAKPANLSWSVQVGIFTKRENAERMMHEAQGKGFNVTVSNADSKGMFHVRATGLADHSAAQTLSQKMKAAGLPAAVVAP